MDGAECERIVVGNAEAAAQLEAATLRMEQADGARDRVKALSETIHAYEAGLAAMRDGLRGVARRETQLTAQLQSREGEIAAHAARQYS